MYLDLIRDTVKMAQVPTYIPATCYLLPTQPTTVLYCTVSGGGLPKEGTYLTYLHTYMYMYLLLMNF